MAITSTLSLAVGLLGARFGSGFELPERVRWGVSRALLGAVALIILIGLVALFRSDGGRADSSTNGLASSPPGHPTWRARAAATGST